MIDHIDAQSMNRIEQAVNQLQTSQYFPGPVAQKKMIVDLIDSLAF